MKGVWRWGEREIIYLSLHCHHQNDFCIKMGSDESHFNVSVGSDGQSHKTVSTNHNLFEEKGEPKRYRTEVLPLTSLTPYRYAKAAHYGHRLVLQNFIMLGGAYAKRLLRHVLSPLHVLPPVTKHAAMPARAAATHERVTNRAAL